MAQVYPFLPGEERTPGNIPGRPIAVVIGGVESPVDLAGARITPLADGSIEIDFDPGNAMPEIPEDANEHDANIAPFLTEAQRSSIAEDVLEMVEQDIESRKPWFERFSRGLEKLGVKDEQGVEPPFKGASKVVHPLIAEAIVQFQARALKELFPPTGPAKGVVLGERTREKEQQAERVKNYLNYQVTVEDDTYYPESDQMLWLVGFIGNAFRKCYPDPFTGRNVARLVHAEELIVPYRASSLKTSPRFTHLLTYTQDEMRRLQHISYFMDAALGIPAGTVGDGILGQPAQDAKDEAQGKTDPDMRDEDRDHVVLEMNVYYDVPGFGDTDETGSQTGIALPWVISVERDSRKVLSIRRGWREFDPLRERRMYFTHYPFIRGDGFYAYGLIHLVGGLGDAATGALRSILDNAAFSSLQGGFKTKTGKIASDITMEPGVWKDVDLTYEELSKAFFNPPFHPVPEAMFRVLGLLTEMGRRFASTTEATVGDAPNTGPVGTTVALIEQGSKVHSGIHSRLHVALGQELRILAELNGENLPDGGYPYDVPGESRMILREDFDGRVDVIPVSDPNIFSQTQRIAQAQTRVQLSESAPDLYDRRAVHKRFLEAIQDYDIDEILVNREKVQRCDPVTENALAIVGRPIKTFMDQDHDAHIAVHYGQLQIMAAQGAPGLELFQQIIMPHISEHQALGMRLKMASSIGIMLPPLNLDAEHDEPVTIELPPQAENMVAMRAAQATQTLLAQLRQAQPAGEGKDDQAAAQAEEARRDESFEREERRKDVRLQHDMEREDAKAGIDPKSVREAQRYLQALSLDRVITPRRLAVVSRELGTSFGETIRMLMRIQSAGQGMGPAPIVNPDIRR